MPFLFCFCSFKNSKIVGKSGSSVQVRQQPKSPAPPAAKSKSSGFKAALSALRNKLRTEQKQEVRAGGKEGPESQVNS